MVLSVNSARQTMTVSHRDISGYMPAMVMPFHVESTEDLAKLRPGSRVHFELKVGRHSSIARRVKSDAAVAEGVNKDEEFRVPVPTGKVVTGNSMPDFLLTDELSRPVSLSSFRGKVVVADFIYTRCPLPDVCPRLSANFALLQKKFRQELGEDLVLLSITIDPQYDQPAVLRDYAKRWRADRAWHFLTGSAEQIQKTAGYFGLVYWPEEGVLTHTSATGIIDREGRLAALVEGSSYPVRQLVDLVAFELKAPRK